MWYYNHNAPVLTNGCSWQFQKITAYSANYKQKLGEMRVSLTELSFTKYSVDVIIEAIMTLT